MPAVSNTSPLSNLARIERLLLLREQFNEIWIPSAVQVELQADPITHSAIEASLQEGWLKVKQIADTRLAQLLSAELDKGECEAIALAAELNVDWILMDEREGRKAATRLGLRVTGALGVLLRARNTGRIPSMKSELRALRELAGFYISPALEHDLLRAAGE